MRVAQHYNIYFCECVRVFSCQTKNDFVTIRDRVDICNIVHVTNDICNIVHVTNMRPEAIRGNSAQGVFDGRFLPEGL